ncbi:YceI family protein [Aquimarina sp. 2201CG14-23]|uniref:YceI family protein n=1 Tax=Aquimarina mycalae TaxID=3040073 RepID=UPI0024782774|nr:YceI family protein [Aquimarina sp. 2201CG14-23]MDH7444702.1 YceI family protein [Aquimarina sp. 2201CG14-23]
MNTKFLITVISIVIVSVIHISFKTITDQYTLDTGHTFVGFDVERFMVGEVSGRFNEFTGNVTMENEDVTSLKVEVIIQTNSLDTNNEIRDGHLKGKIWLDVENHPEIKFTSSNIIKNNNGNYVMEGSFTLKEVTKTIKFPIEILGPFMDPTKKMTVGIKADFEIDRFDYGIKFNKKMDNGSFFIDNKVKIKIRALAYKN